MNIHGSLEAIGLALLVLFFVAGVVKTCGSFTELKKPEHAIKIFVGFAIAKGVVTYGLELMLALFIIAQGIINTIMKSSGIGGVSKTTLLKTIIKAVEECGFFESIPLWAITLIGSLFITIMSFIIILTVYGRFFKLYIYTAIAPIPLATFAGEPTQSIGISFLKSYAAVCLKGAIIVLACIIFFCIFICFYIYFLSLVTIANCFLAVDSLKQLPSQLLLSLPFQLQALSFCTPHR